MKCAVCGLEFKAEELFEMKAAGGAACRKCIYEIRHQISATKGGKRFPNLDDVDQHVKKNKESK